MYFISFVLTMHAVQCNKGNNGIVASLFIHFNWYETHSVNLIIQIICSKRASNQAECCITKSIQELIYEVHSKGFTHKRKYHSSICVSNYCEENVCSIYAAYNIVSTELFPYGTYRQMHIQISEINR